MHKILALSLLMAAVANAAAVNQSVLYWIEQTKRARPFRSPRPPHRLHLQPNKKPDKKPDKKPGQ